MILHILFLQRDWKMDLSYILYKILHLKKLIVSQLDQNNSKQKLDTKIILILSFTFNIIITDISII